MQGVEAAAQGRGRIDSPPTTCWNNFDDHGKKGAYALSNYHMKITLVYAALFSALNVAGADQYVRSLFLFSEEKFACANSVAEIGTNNQDGARRFEYIRLDGSNLAIDKIEELNSILDKESDYFTIDLVLCTSPSDWVMSLRQFTHLGDTDEKSAEIFLYFGPNGIY